MTQYYGIAYAEVAEVKFITEKYNFGAMFDVCDAITNG